MYYVITLNVSKISANNNQRALYQSCAGMAKFIPGPYLPGTGMGTGPCTHTRVPVPLQSFNGKRKSVFQVPVIGLIEQIVSLKTAQVYDENFTRVKMQTTYKK